jgi:hypothetical protein
MRRVYFIYHYGFESGFWRTPGHDMRYPGCREHMEQTYANVGDFLPAAVRFAHEADLELHAVLKPFESGFPFTFAADSEHGRELGKVPRLGGTMWWCTDFLAQHPHLRIGRRRAAGADSAGTTRVGRIIIAAEPGSAAGIDPSRVHLWTSDDNGVYRPCQQPVSVQLVQAGASSALEIAAPDLVGPYMAVTVDGDPTHGFGNVVRDLVTVYDNDGRILPVTLSTKVNPTGTDFRTAGFAWDVPGREDAGEYNYADSYDCIDAGEPLGIAVGHEPFLAGALSPCCDEVRAWWLKQVQNCIDAGADGVDFRIANHNMAIDWSDYGFEQPIVDVFGQRYGVNILAEPFEREAWRRVRGEFYTEFLRCASARLRAAGRRVSAHVSAYMDEPRIETVLNIHWDWPRWIDDGLVDEITVKRWRMDALTNGLAPRIVAKARDAGIPVNYCPYLNTLPHRSDGRDVLAFHVREAQEGDADRFILYENAAFMRARDDGGIEIPEPWMVELLQTAFG